MTSRRSAEAQPRRTHSAAARSIARVALGILVIWLTGCAEPVPDSASSTPKAAPRVVVLAIARPDAREETSDLAAGLALEVAHRLSGSPDVIVREVSGPAVLEAAPFAQVAERLAVDHVIWIGVEGPSEMPVVTYRLEGSPGELLSERQTTSRDSLTVVPGRVAGHVLTALTDAALPSTKGLESPLPAPAGAYREFLLALGHASISSMDPSGRVAAFQGLAAQLDGYAPARAELGSAYLDRAGELGGAGPFYQLAEESISRAHGLAPGYPPARRLLASYLAKVGRSEESLALLLEGLAGHPVFPGFHDQIGYVLRYAGLFDASIESYQRSQELDGSLENLVASQDQITKSLIYLGRYPDALASHEQMESFLGGLGRSPDEKEWFYRGVIHLYAREQGLALEAFGRGEALDPQSIWTTFGRGYAGMARGDSAVVSDVLAELERLQVVDGERHYRLVHFASFLGDLDSALEHLEITVSSGFFAAPYLAADPMTVGLRSHPDFTRVLDTAEERHATFQRMLTKAAR